MEEEKAAAYYEELTRKGEGAARFKQGLGFSSNDAVPSRGNNKLQFVKASSPSKTPHLEKEAQLNSIKEKLSKTKSRSSRQSSFRDRDGSERRRSRSRSRSPRREGRNRSPTREDRRSSTHRRRSSSRERDRYRDRDRDRDRERRRKRSLSPRDRRSMKSKKDGIDYAKLIPGYDHMSPAERVKEKMKLQLSETAKNDTANGKGPGWERFDFDKDAPLDDEEIIAAEDDKELVKHIGQSFRFSTVEARKDEKIKAAHDEAMFGAPSLTPADDTDTEVEEDKGKRESTVTISATSLISDQVVMQQGSWRDRARKA